MLHLALPDVVQVWVPMPIVNEILGDMRGQKNVPRVTAVEYTLGHIDSGARDVCFVIDIGDPIDRPTVNAHAYLELRMTMQRCANSQSAAHRLFRAAKKKQRHPVTGWHSKQFITCLRSAKTCRCANDLIQLLEHFNLLVHEQFRITDNID